MGAIATALKHLIAAGVTGDALILAVSEMEQQQATNFSDAAAEKRRAWDRDRKRAQKEAKRALISTGIPPDPVESAENAELSSPLDKETSPRPPKEINPPARDDIPRARKGTRLPEAFEPKIVGQTAEMLKRWPPGRFDREVAQFRDHYAKTGGDKGLSLDWQASLRTWLRNADDRMPRNGRIPDPQSPGIGRTAAAALDVFGPPS